MKRVTELQAGGKTGDLTNPRARRDGEFKHLTFKDGSCKKKKGCIGGGVPRVKRLQKEIKKKKLEVSVKNSGGGQKENGGRLRRGKTVVSKKIQNGGVMEGAQEGVHGGSCLDKSKWASGKKGGWEASP